MENTKKDATTKDEIKKSIAELQNTSHDKVAVDKKKQPKLTGRKELKAARVKKASKYEDCHVNVKGKDRNLKMLPKIVKYLLEDENESMEYVVTG